MNYITWKGYLESKQKLQKVIHTNPNPLEKEILRTNVDYLEAKIMSAPDYYWTDYVKEGYKNE